MPLGQMVIACAVRTRVLLACSEEALDSLSPFIASSAPLTYIAPC